MYGWGVQENVWAGGSWEGAHLPSMSCWLLRFRRGCLHFRPDYNKVDRSVGGTRQGVHGRLEVEWEGVGCLFTQGSEVVGDVHEASLPLLPH